jgi:hypothetical protein
MKMPLKWRCLGIQMQESRTELQEHFHTIQQVWVYYTFGLVYLLFLLFLAPSRSDTPAISIFFFTFQQIKMPIANFGTQSDDSKICVVMVGLPARGKSLIAGKGK